MIRIALAFALLFMGLAVPTPVEAQAGRGCSVFNQCPNGYSCMPFRQVCHRDSGAREGEACQAGYECARGYNCEAGSQVCRRPGRVGDACHATRPCGDGLSCQPGVHQCYHTPRRAGEPCSAGFSCGQGLHCQSFLQKCTPNTVNYNSNSSCSALRVQATAEDARRAGVTMAFSAGSSGGAGAFITYETGVVYGENGEFGCFATACLGSQSNVSLGNFANFGLYNRYSDFEGFSIVTGQGVSTPFAQLGFQTSQVFSAEPPRNARQFLRRQLVGTASGLTFGVGLSPVTVGQALCYTARLDAGNPLRNFSDIERILNDWAEAGFSPDNRPQRLGGAAPAAQPAPQPQQPQAQPRPPQAQPQPQAQPRAPSAPPARPAQRPTPLGDPGMPGFGTDGRRATTVFFAQGNGQVLGWFGQYAQGWWAEYDMAGQPKFTFRETGRDDWSIYLWDDARGLGVQLDLHTRRVNLKPNAQAPYQGLYIISNAHHAGGPARPASAPTPAGDPSRQGFGTDGRRVTTVFFGNAQGQQLGRFSQVRAGVWQEFDGNNQARFTFREAGRDDWSVYLWDDARGVGIQLDLHTRRVNFKPNASAPYGHLYNILNAN